ncbi:hypothetical protein [Peribacillus muralis]|uniref:hypothetical protein n=1 Tax=Peribacillus muralis TaxID=264697 RepID=UPI00366F0C99
MVTLQLIKSVASSDAETRKILKVILDLDDEMQEIREVANKLNASNDKAIQEIVELKKDKAALMAFIRDNVTDETKLNQIFKGDK